MRSRGALRALVIVVVALAASGCEAILGLSGLSPAADAGNGDGGRGSDGGRESGADATLADVTIQDATVQDTTIRDAAPRDARGDKVDASCATVYVNGSAGKDSNSGCSPDEAKQTITGGLGVSTATEVRVCAGSYDETNLTVSRAVSLRGSYSCSTWRHSTGWGYPKFDGVTVINPGATQANTATLTIEAAPTDGGAGFLVDGLEIIGPSSLITSRALFVEKSANPTISNNLLHGGVLASSGSGDDIVIGLDIDEAAPTVTSNRVAMPEASFPGTVVGVRITSGSTTASAARVSGNDIDLIGSAGTANAASPGTLGSVGVLFAASGSTGTPFTVLAGAPLEGNVIKAGRAIPTRADSPAAAGVYVGPGMRVDLVSNSISGGTCAPSFDGGTIAVSAGVFVNQASARLLGNRIYGGEEELITTAGGGQAAAKQGTAGVLAIESNVVIVDNVIHGGSVPSAKADAGPTVRGIKLNESDGSVIEDNTIFAGLVDDPLGANSFVLDLYEANGSVIRGNLLAGAGLGANPERSYVMTVGACQDVALLEGNLFVDTAADAAPQVVDGCRAFDGGPKGTSSMQTVEKLFAGERVRTNVLVTNTCERADRDAGLCLPSCPAGGCLPWLLHDWVGGAPNGVFADGGEGWSLQAEAGCLASRGVNLAHAEAGPPVTADILDAARPADGSSMGAFQFHGTCR
jgi:hypothetical protein